MFFYTEKKTNYDGCACRRRFPSPLKIRFVDPSYYEVKCHCFCLCCALLVASVGLNIFFAYKVGEFSQTIKKEGDDWLSA